MQRQNEALTRSSVAISSAERVRSAAGSRSASCSGEFAPMMGAAIAGFVICQASATAAGVVSWAAATASRRLDGGEAGGVHVLADAAGAGALRAGLAGAVLAGEEAGGERAVRDDADVFALAE